MAIDVGSVYEATLTVADKTGTPVNPATAVLTVTLPDQTTYVTGIGANPPVTLPPVTTGLVLYDYLTTQPGLTRLAWTGTMPGGAPLPPKVDYINVRGYISAVSLAEAKEHLGYSKTDKDERIRSLCSAATRAAEKIVGTIVPRAFTADWCPGSYRPVIRLPHGPALTAASVTAIRSVYSNGPSWAGADVICNPVPGTVYLRSLLNFWYGPWTVDYTGGRAVVEEDITLGVLEILRDLFTPARGLSADVAEQQSDALQVSPFYRPPPRAAQLLEPYRLPGFA